MSPRAATRDADHWMTVSWTCLSSHPTQHLAEAGPHMRDRTVVLPVTRDVQKPVGSLCSVATIPTRSLETFRQRFHVLLPVRPAIYLAMLHLAIFERRPRHVLMGKSMIITDQVMRIENMLSVLFSGSRWTSILSTLHRPRATRLPSLTNLRATLA